MMNTIVKGSILLFLLLICLESSGQITGKYFWYNEGTKKRWDISEDKIEMADWFLWSESPQWENPKIRLILERSDTKLLTKESDADYYKVFEVVKPSEYGSMGVFSYPSRKTKEEAMRDFRLSEDENMLSLFAVPFFNTEESEELESRKGLDEITRDELIELLNNRKEFGDRITQMLEDNEDDKRLSSQMVMFRLSQSLFQKEAINMGFNPYKPTEGNPMKKFRDDEEIQKMMNEPLVDSGN